MGPMRNDSHLSNLAVPIQPNIGLEREVRMAVVDLLNNNPDKTSERVLGDFVLGSWGDYLANTRLEVQLGDLPDLMDPLVEEKS